MDRFALIEYDEAQLFRNIRYLSEMLRQVQGITRKRMDTMQNVFFGREMFNAMDRQTVNQPVHLFAAIYESIEDNFDGGDNALFVEMNRILEEAMGKIIQLCPDIETSSFPNMQIECPFCGKKSDAARYAGKSVTLKCTDCKKYFRVNLEELSVEPLRDNQPEEQKKGQEKTDSHAMERLMNDMPWWLRNLTAKYVDKYI